MKRLASSLTLVLCVALCGTTVSAAKLVALTGFTGTADAKLLQSLDRQAIALISASPGFKGIPAKMICGDPATSAAAAGAYYYIAGALGAGGHSMNVRLYFDGNLIPLRTVTVHVAGGQLNRTEFAQLFDRSRWSKATSPAGSC